MTSGRTLFCRDHDLRVFAPAALAQQAPANSMSFFRDQRRSREGRESRRPAWARIATARCWRQAAGAGAKIVARVPERERIGRPSRNQRALTGSARRPGTTQKA